MNKSEILKKLASLAKANEELQSIVIESLPDDDGDAANSDDGDAGEGGGDDGAEAEEIIEVSPQSDVRVPQVKSTGRVTGARKRSRGTPPNGGRIDRGEQRPRVGANAIPVPAVSTEDQELRGPGGRAVKFVG